MAEMGSAWDTCGCPGEVCEGNEMELRPNTIGEEARADLNELRCPGWVTYVWRLEAANLIHSHLCIFHLLFRVHRRSEI